MAANAPLPLNKAGTEGYAAGKMKHLHTALRDEKVLVIVIAPHDGLCEKTVSNMQKVMARRGKVLTLSVCW
jgi:glutamine---fructose-6-phosphate transaminase (isomerizing)